MADWLKTRPVKCKACGSVFRPLTNSNAETCSNACRQRWYRTKKAMFRPKRSERRKGQ